MLALANLVITPGWFDRLGDLAFSDYLYRHACLHTRILTAGT
jgi:hypothetical protein